MIARRISQPIEEISECAKALASGDYDIRFGSRGFLEIGELSDTLNTAAVELSKVETLRRELMANVSHDLRTPLALIYSYAEMMHDFPTEVTPEQTQTVMDETKRLTSLVNDVLDVSRLESGTMELHPSRYNLTECLNDTILRTAELVKKDGYSIAFEQNGEVYVKADEIKITQAFYNLLINAVHYSTADKKITVRQSEADGKVKISVIDNGDGIAPENLPYIWDRYYKIDKKHKRAITGTGLGLSIVKKIVELHGGSYGVESEPGRGSTFWFELNRA
jgi:signal transduction histidine kinase